MLSSVLGIAYNGDFLIYENLIEYILNQSHPVIQVVC